MMTAQEILKQYWGFDHFRECQEEIINSVMQGFDTLALLPTGGGKSVCFQVPALLKPGICLVVTPLIALMNDQVENLKAKGIKAVAVSSALSIREIDTLLDNCVFGNIKFLYVSPERLQTEMFRVRVQKMNVNLIAIDEAHCISQWGYDFRPPYLQIAELRTLLPKVPFLALTATATPEVVQDIQHKLEFKKHNVFERSFERKNLSYIVLKEESKAERLIKICKNTPGTGIVYVRNRRKTVELAQMLNRQGISADFYHAGLIANDRAKREHAWKTNAVRVMVSTNAFGMGIDKPDVRFVVHWELPDTLEAYFQEAGRAGRDEKPAFAIALYNDADLLELETTVERSFPPLEEIKRVYQAIANYLKIAIGAGAQVTYPFAFDEFCSTYNFNPALVYNVLKLLEREELVMLTEQTNQPSRLKITATRQVLYEHQVRNPSLDQFVKLLLRSYGGLFEEYVRINEYDLAKRSQLVVESIYRNLQNLQTYHLVDYIPRTNKPQLYFMSERIDVRNLRISPEHLAKRKALALKKVEAVKQYPLSDHVCRSVYLIQYFGQTNAQPCGHCDVCRKRKKSQQFETAFQYAKMEVLTKLQQQSLSVQELCEKCKTDSEVIIEVIRQLIDENQLSKTPDGMLEVVK